MADRAVLKSRSIETDEGAFAITLAVEDLSGIYPRMQKYTVEIVHEGKTVYTYAINSYEEPPGMLFDPGEVAEIVFSRLAYDVASRPSHYSRLTVAGRQLPGEEEYDVVILQGSPRRFGNSARIAAWCDDEAARAGAASHIFYLQEMDLHPCSGCYTCYDYGYCPVQDDMPAIIKALEHASLLVVCTPVYTNTVPAVLKAVMDRCQWLHARRHVLGGTMHTKGLLICTAGRRGDEPFECVRKVTDAFMKNLGIEPAEPILIGDLDRIRDVQSVEGLEGEIRSRMHSLLTAKNEG
jgi:multimeric flavodoxin WrbA